MHLLNNMPSKQNVEIVIYNIFLSYYLENNYVHVYCLVRIIDNILGMSGNQLLQRTDGQSGIFIDTPSFLLSNITYFLSLSLSLTITINYLVIYLYCVYIYQHIYLSFTIT